MNTTAERVKALIAEQFGIDAEHVTAEKQLSSDLGFDSLEEVELIIELENEFDIQIPDKEAAACNTVGEIVALVERLVGAKA